MLKRWAFWSALILIAISLTACIQKPTIALEPSSISTPIISSSPAKPITTMMTVQSSSAPPSTAVTVPKPILSDTSGVWKKFNFSSGTKCFLVRGQEVWMDDGDGLMVWDMNNSSYHTIPLPGDPLNNNIIIGDGMLYGKISSMVFDKSGNLWVGTRNRGLCRYDGKDWQIFASEEKGIEVCSVLIDKAGKIWFGTNKGVNCLMGEEWQFWPIFNGFHDVVLVNGLTQDPQGNIWAADYSGSVQCYDGKSWASFYPVKLGAMPLEIVNIYSDTEGNIWVGTAGGVYCYDMGSDLAVARSWTKYSSMKTYGALPDSLVYNIHQDSFGNLWFASSSGLSRYDGKTWRTYTSKSGLPTDQVYCSTSDSQGNIWFGGPNGIFCYSPKQETSPNSGANISVAPLPSPVIPTTISGTWKTFDKTKSILSFTFKGNELWASSQTDGIVRWNMENDSFQKYFEEEGPKFGYPTPLVVDNQGNVWVCIRGKGLFYYDGQKWQNAPPYTTMGIGWITTVFKDRAGKLWFGGDGGIACLDGGKWQIWHPFQHKYPDGRLAPETYNTIAQDPSGHVWCCDGSYSLAWFDGKDWHVKHLPKSIVIENMIIDNQEFLWISAWVYGVYRHKCNVDDSGNWADMNEWTLFTIRDGLAGGEVDYIFQDAGGKIWFLTNGGLNCYDGRGWTVTGKGLFDVNRGYHSINQDSMGHIWVGIGILRYLVP